MCTSGATYLPATAVVFCLFVFVFFCFCFFFIVFGPCPGTTSHGQIQYNQDLLSTLFLTNMYFWKKNKKIFGGLIAFRVGVPVNYIPTPIGSMIMMMTIADLVNKGSWIVVVQSGELTP